MSDKLIVIIMLVSLLVTALIVKNKDAIDNFSLQTIIRKQL